MGSRYGGLKQLDSMGPNGETVLDYSVYDAIQAGFTRVVFVIRKEFEDAFVEAVGKKFDDRIEVAYAFQDLHDLPAGFSVPHGREKPWGTAHAVLAAKDQVTGPFAVINADDFYGRDAYQQIAHCFSSSNHQEGILTTMVSYPLSNTLSANGSVNRGICEIIDGSLQSVEEYHELRSETDIRTTGLNPNNERVELHSDTSVSMNFWGFNEHLFPALEEHFVDFLKSSGQKIKSECYLPTVIDSLIKSNKTKCTVLSTSGLWFGVTYPSDKPLVKKSIQQLIDNGDYPKSILS